MWNDDMGAAPKDGTKVDLYYAKRGRVTDCHYRHTGIAGWVREHGYPTQTTVFFDQPTHWAPIVLPVSP